MCSSLVGDGTDDVLPVNYPHDLMVRFEKSGQLG